AARCIPSARSRPRASGRAGPPAGSFRSPWLMSATCRPTSAASRCSRAISRGRFSASCSARRRAACSASCSAGAASFSCSRDCSRWRPQVFELLANPRTRAAGHGEETSRGFIADDVAGLSNPWARFVILAVFIEASVGWGAFAYVGADLHLRFGLTFSAIGLIVGTFGIGGLLYAASVQQLVNRFGQAGLAIFGGV